MGLMVPDKIISGKIGQTAELRQQKPDQRGAPGLGIEALSRRECNIGKAVEAQKGPEVLRSQGFFDGGAVNPIVKTVFGSSGKSCP